MCISKGKLKEKVILISLSVPQGLNVFHAHLGCLKGRSRRLVRIQFLHCSSELSAFSQAFIFFPLDKLNFTCFSCPVLPSCIKQRSNQLTKARQAQLSGVRREMSPGFLCPQERETASQSIKQKSIIFQHIVWQIRKKKKGQIKISKHTKAETWP